jgi:hypothetical protein
VFQFLVVLVQANTELLLMGHLIVLLLTHIEMGEALDPFFFFVCLSEPVDGLDRRSLARV